MPTRIVDGHLEASSKELILVTSMGTAFSPLANPEKKGGGRP